MDARYECHVLKFEEEEEDNNTDKVIIYLFGFLRKPCNMLHAEMNLEEKLEDHLKAFEKLFKADKNSPDVYQPCPNPGPKLQLPSVILEPFPSKDVYLTEASTKNQFIEFNQCALDIEKAELDAVNRTISSMKQKYEEMQKDNEELKKHHSEINKQHEHMRETLADVTKSHKEFAMSTIEATKRNLMSVEIRLDKIRSHAPVIYGLYENVIDLHQQTSHLQSWVSDKEETLKILDIQKVDNLRKTREYEAVSLKAQEKLQEVKSRRRSWVPVTEKDFWSVLDVACDACSKLVENMKNASCKMHEDVESPVEVTPRLASYDDDMTSENI